MRELACLIGIVGLLVGCSSSGGEPPAPPSGSVAPSSTSADAAGSAVSPASAWIREAPDFDAFVKESTSFCARAITVEQTPEGWTKAYEMTLPSIAPDALEKQFRAHAAALHLEVTNTLGSLITAGDERRGVSAALGGEKEMLIVSVRLPKPDLAAELRRTLTGGPPELELLVAAVGGTDALSSLRTAEGGALGHDISIQLIRNKGLTDEAVAEAAKKAGLVPKDAGAFGSPKPPAPGAWFVGLVAEPTSISIHAGNPGASRPPACERHPSRTAGQSSADPASPKEKATQDEMMKEMLGE